MIHLKNTCKVLLILFIFSWQGQNQNLYSQSFDGTPPANTYRNQGNPFYWKNRPPYPGYWQQDIYYNIKAKIDDVTDIIDGNLELTYWNNSPDTLFFVY